MYFGLLSLHMVSLFSIQCLVLVIMLASSEVSCVAICLFIMSSAFPRPCLLIDRLSSVRLYSFSISTVLILHRLFLWVVSDLFSEGPLLWSILWACIILFFFIIISIGMYPVSDRRIEVGVCWGRYNKVFRALFRSYLVWILAVRLLLSFFLMIFRFFPSIPFLLRTYRIASSHALTYAFSTSRNIPYAACFLFINSFIVCFWTIRWSAVALPGIPPAWASVIFTCPFMLSLIIISYNFPKLLQIQIQNSNYKRLYCHTKQHIIHTNTMYDTVQFLN